MLLLDCGLSVDVEVFRIPLCLCYLGSYPFIMACLCVSPNVCIDGFGGNLGGLCLLGGDLSLVVLVNTGVDSK